MYAKPTVAVRIDIKPNALGGGYRRVIKNARPPNVKVEIVTITRALVVNLKLTLIGFHPLARSLQEVNTCARFDEAI
jgi:hypothetical protein